ncbi:MAG: DUF192 domain-containing protein [Patescibacteria group bacterium]|nr:DUF192 domain-containing protein [Patescibacteria group bacterium]MDE2172350.1 DUF192 domain-containing protein [Patescibacteria group bacterium]
MNISTDISAGNASGFNWKKGVAAIIIVAMVIAVYEIFGAVFHSQERLLSIAAPAGTIYAEIASTSDQQELGLGNRASLPADHGMLFVFPHPGDYGFWMKDMHFDLDMVWISSNKKVVAVSHDVPVDSYPAVFYPPLAVSYVLEINADAASRFGIATDTQLAF